MTPGPWLDYLALGVVIFGVVVLAVGFLWIHELPAMIAKRRNHPQLHAIETGCWLSLVFGGLLWPFIFIWSMMYRPALDVHIVNGVPPGGGAPPEPDADKARLTAEVAELRERLARLEQAAQTKAGG
jgi:hypothetical protein